MSEDQQKFVENEHEGAEHEEGGAESDSDDKRKGRRKIDISFIENKSRRHITFSKRKAGIMKKVLPGLLLPPVPDLVSLSFPRSIRVCLSLSHMRYPCGT